MPFEPPNKVLILERFNFVLVVSRNFCKLVLTLYPSSPNTKSDVESMLDLFSVIRDCLFDHEDGLHQLLTLFLNLVMEVEVLSRPEPNTMSSLTVVKPVETDTKPVSFDQVC